MQDRIHHISADWHTILDQSSKTAELFFDRAESFLRYKYKQALPADIIALAQVAVTDFHATIVGIGAQKIEGAISDLADALAVAADRSE